LEKLMTEDGRRLGGRRQATSRAGLEMQSDGTLQIAVVAHRSSDLPSR
jgi:hypothetical protein